jgi:hypothetical protein
LGKRRTSIAVSAPPAPFDLAFLADRDPGAPAERLDLQDPAVECGDGAADARRRLRRGGASDEQQCEANEAA